MVSVLDSGSKGQGSSPGRVIVLRSRVIHFTLTMPLSTHRYKWVPANMLGEGGRVVCKWTSIQSRKSSNTPILFIPWKSG